MITLDEVISEEKELYEIAKDRYEKLDIKILKHRMEEHKQMIEWLEEFKILKEKSAPKKPIRKPNADMTHEEVTCPSCGRYVSDYTNKVYCDCGQHLCWE